MFVTLRPQISEYRQWTGSNFSELSSWLGNMLTEGPGGSLLVYGEPVPVGSWLNLYGSVYPPDLVMNMSNYGVQECQPGDEYSMTSGLTPGTPEA